MRKAAQIAGAAAIAALLLSGCGSSGGGGTESEADPTPSAAAADKPAGSIDGAWQTDSDGGPVTLAIIGDTATLGAGKTACQGAVQKMGGKTALAMKCNGDDTRAAGTAEPAGDKLRVSWEKGPTEEFTKAEGQVEIPEPTS